MVNFGPQAAEIDPVVWGTPANFNRFHVLASFLHGIPVVGVGQTLHAMLYIMANVLQANKVDTGNTVEENSSVFSLIQMH